MCNWSPLSSDARNRSACPPSTLSRTDRPAATCVNFPVPALRLRMNSAHYDKMKELFRRACVKGTKSLSSWSSAAGAALGHRNSSGGRSGALPPAAWAGDFHDSLFACLMRYEALQASRVLFLFVWFPFILVCAAAVCQ